MDYIVPQLLVDKDEFDIRLPSKVDMPFSKETEPKYDCCELYYIKLVVGHGYGETSSNTG